MCTYLEYGIQTQDLINLCTLSSTLTPCGLNISHDYALISSATEEMKNLVTNDKSIE